MSDPSDRFEVDASAKAERVMSGGEPLMLAGSADSDASPAQVQRDEASEEEEQLE